MNRTALLCLLALTLTSTLWMVPKTAAAVDGSWQLESSGNVPADSFVGGTTRTNLSIFICRVIPSSDVKIVGRMIAPNGSSGPGCVYVKESEILTETDEYRVLEDHQAYAWLDWTGSLPDKAIKAGFGVGQTDNEQYICQATSPDNASAQIPGKFRDRDNTCQIVYGKGPKGKRTVHETTSDFKILVKE